VTGYWRGSGIPRIPRQSTPRSSRRLASADGNGESVTIRTSGSANNSILVWLPTTQMRLTAVYMKVPEGYIAFVEELPGANTQGETLEEARANLEEAVTMVLDANRELSEQSLRGR